MWLRCVDKKLRRFTILIPLRCEMCGEVFSLPVATEADINALKVVFKDHVCKKQLLCAVW